MARVTIEDCIDKVEDRFELVALANKRTKDVAAGAALTIDANDEKNTVLALREIAAGSVSVEELRENLVKSLQKERESEEEIDTHIGGSVESELEASQEDEELKQLQAQEQESLEPISEEVAEEEAAEQVEDDELSFEEDNIDVDD